MIAMTDPTREAFEAWANANGIFDETARAFARDTWQAALAQQGRGVEADTLRTARSAAYRNRFDHAYLPQTSEAAAIWAPHEWVIEAMEAHARNCHAARLAAAPKQQAVDKETLVAFERVFWKAVELSGSRNFDHDVCKEVRDFRSLLAALPGKTEVDRG